VSTQLAILAAAAIVAAERDLFLVVRFLAGHAETDAGNRLPPCLRDFLTAFLTVEQAGAFRQLAAGALDAVLDGGVDLVLNGAVMRPAGSHGDLPIRLS